MKTWKSFYLLALAATLAFTGCKKDDEGASRSGELTVGQTEYTLGAAEDRTAAATFTAPADWTLTVTYEDAADWLTVTPASGTAGEQTVELSAAENTQTASRTAYVDLACGEETVRLTVTQAAASGETDFTVLFDPGFAQKLQELGHISDAENITSADMEKIAAITELDVSGTYENENPGTLTSLQGIEYFESLTELVCYYNQLTSLDVSANTALTVLDCSSNSLTSLDVSANTALTELWCGYNQLTSLDVSANTALTTLWCYYNQLESLDVSANTALTELECDDNQLTSLDVSANTALTYLDCASNQLTTLDVSGCTALTELSCYSNQLTSLDVSANTALTALNCYDNQLTTLDVSGCTALTQLWCEDNPGDGVSTFPVTAWFDNDTKPDNLEIYQEQWTYGGKTITIEFQKAE